MHAILMGEFLREMSVKKKMKCFQSRVNGEGWRWAGAEKERASSARCWMSGLILNEFQPFLRPCLLSHARAAIFISPRSKLRSNKSVEFHSLHKERENLQKWVCSAGRCLLLLHVEIRKIREPPRRLFSHFYLRKCNPGIGEAIHF